MLCVSGVHCHISLCLLLVEVFAIPGEPCYQILKMLSSLPRLPSRAGDMSPSPLYCLSLSSLSTPSLSKCHNLFQSCFSSALHYFFHTLILSILFIPYFATYHLLQVLLLYGLMGDFFQTSIQHVKCRSRELFLQCNHCSPPCRSWNGLDAIRLHFK